MTPTRNRRLRRIALLTTVLAIVAAAVILPTPATGQADLSLGDMTVSGTNQTVTSDVSDVRIQSTIDYEHDVPDVDRRIVTLKAGPSPDDLETMDFRTATPTGADSGSTTLSGSLTDHPRLSAADFDPAVAGNTTEEITVQAILEVRRENGPTVTEQVTKTATVTVQDDTELVVNVGADTTVEVTTA